jgi:hypothetical protein
LRQAIGALGLVVERLGGPTAEAEP